MHFLQKMADAIGILRNFILIAIVMLAYQKHQSEQELKKEKNKMVCSECDGKGEYWESVGTAHTCQEKLVMYVVTVVGYIKT